MPLYLKRNFEDDIEVGMWLMDEDVDYFQSRMSLHPEEVEEIKDLNHRKLKEWYCSRYLLHLMSGRESRGACLKDKYGKPYLKDSEYNISMSHSRNMCGVIASKKHIGLDIQILVSKIERIHQKFMSTHEQENLGYINRVEKIHIYWGAKESLFKIYGKKEVAFKKHLFVEDFEYSENENIIKGKIIKEDFNNKYIGKAFMVDDYMICFLAEE
jgi:phosphopantetheinyl transferase (holo-ACP synthase)